VWAYLRTVLRLAPARPALPAGVRTAVAATVPLSVALLVPMPGAVWVAVAAFMASAVDKGGAYRTRARTLGALTLFTGLGGVIGALAASHPVAAVPITLLWVTASGLAYAYGDGAASVGTVAAVVFVVSLSDPAPDLMAAVSRGGLLVGGGVWAMALALGLWPIRVYRPARQAVASAYRVVADYASEIAELAATPAGDGWQGQIERSPARIRQVLEQGRMILLAIRRGRARESGRGERLLVLLENADRMFANLVALANVLESEGRAGRSHRERSRVASEVAAFAATAREIARAIQSESTGAVPIPASWSLDADRDAAMTEAAGVGSSAEASLPLGGIPEARPGVGQAGLGHGAGDGAGAPAWAGSAIRLLARLREYAANAADVAASMADERPSPRRQRVERAQPPVDPPSLLAPLRESLAPGSLVLQHALRVGITAAVAVALSTALRLDHGYWIAMTSVVVLQPYMGATVQRGLQRVAGTVIGAAVAALLAATVHDPRGILVFVFLFSGASVALLPLSYAVFAMFLTPAFVLLAEVVSGDWQLAGVRTVNTLIGGGLALAAIRLLWPSPERQRLPEHVAEALRACGVYLGHATDSFSPRKDHPQGHLGDVRRAFGLAANNAETSLQRLLQESPTQMREAEAYMTLIAYTRRVVAAAIALAATRRFQSGGAEEEALAHFGRTSRQVLDDLADAVLHTRPPLPLSEPSGPVFEDEDLRATSNRVTRQLGVLHGTVARLVGTAAPSKAASAPEPHAARAPRASD